MPSKKTIEFILRLLIYILSAILGLITGTGFAYCIESLQTTL